MGEESGDLPYGGCQIPSNKKGENALLISFHILCPEDRVFSPNSRYSSTLLEVLIIHNVELQIDVVLIPSTIDSFNAFFIREMATHVFTIANQLTNHES
ncbi:hypothetical protein ACNKHV_20530 [Shigella flexneri]